MICQPEYDDPQASSIIGINYRAYDVLPVPCRKKGTLQFDFEIDTDTNEMKLTIKHKKSGRGGRFTEVEAGRVRSLGSRLEAGHFRSGTATRTLMCQAPRPS